MIRDRFGDPSRFSMQWSRTRTLVTGGASFIGSHLVDALVARGAAVRIVDNLTSGRLDNLRPHLDAGRDIVAGTILAAERLDDGTAVNLGTMERTRVLDAAREVLRYTAHDADIELHPDMPTGPLNRVADNTLARRALGWEPRVRFVDGLHETIDWYFSSKDRDAVALQLASRLTER